MSVSFSPSDVAKAQTIIARIRTQGMELILPCDETGTRRLKYIPEQNVSLKQIEYIQANAQVLIHALQIEEGATLPVLLEKMQWAKANRISLPDLLELTDLPLFTKSLSERFYRCICEGISSSDVYCDRAMAFLRGAIKGQARGEQLLQSEQKG